MDSYIRWNFTFATRAGKCRGQKRSRRVKRKSSYRPHNISPCEHQKPHWYSHSFHFKAYQPRIGRSMWKGSQSGWRSWYGNTMCLHFWWSSETRGFTGTIILLKVSNNPSIRAEDDPGTARSKQTTSKRKKVKSNDCNKMPRKWNVCNRRQKTLLKDYT